jgi:hypothetical protein
MINKNKGMNNGKIEKKNGQHHFNILFQIQ